MNCYILYCQSLKVDKLINTFNKKKGLFAFIPQYEYYRRDIKGYSIKPLFPGYIFIRTEKNQRDFDFLLCEMYEERDGLIRQLKYDNTSALNKDEIEMFHKLLDEDGVLRMSQAYLVDNKAVVYEGPLNHFEKNIYKVDKHNQLAYLDISFMKRNIIAGLCFKKAR